MPRIHYWRPFKIIVWWIYLIDWEKISLDKPVFSEIKFQVLLHHQMGGILGNKMNSVFLEWKLRKASMYVWCSNQMLKAIEISILTSQ